MMNIKMLAGLCKMKDKPLHLKLLKLLKETYGIDKVISTPMYIMATGNIPICLVAHLDTVFDETLFENKEIYYDSEKSIMWSPHGLGTDDRAGVYAILQLIEKGYRPHIIFTQGEERGCLGARALVHRFPKCPWKNLKYILQLDRRGEKDCVFYECANEEFEKYINSFDFTTEWGTFSDISEIAPIWKIAAVNLSVGYINEHSYSEMCNTAHLEMTINKVEKMLIEAKNAKKYKYKKAPFTYLNENVCLLCGKTIEEESKYACVCKECSASW